MVPTELVRGEATVAALPPLEPARASLFEPRSAERESEHSLALAERLLALRLGWMPAAVKYTVAAVLWSVVGLWLWRGGRDRDAC